MHAVSTWHSDGVPSRGCLKQNFVEHGFCWSTEPEPTILDNRTTEYIEVNGHLRIEEPDPFYHLLHTGVCLDQRVSRGYGDAIKVITIPKGTITWSYNNGDAESNAASTQP